MTDWHLYSVEVSIARWERTLNRAVKRGHRLDCSTRIGGRVFATFAYRKLAYA